MGQRLLQSSSDIFFKLGTWQARPLRAGMRYDPGPRPRPIRGCRDDQRIPGKIRYPRSVHRPLCAGLRGPEAARSRETDSRCKGATNQSAGRRRLVSSSSFSAFTRAQGRKGLSFGLPAGVYVMTDIHAKRHSNKGIERAVKAQFGRAASAVRYVALAPRSGRRRAAAQAHR